MRIALFGGTFDPPHLGHLIAAIDAVEALSADRLVLIPANAQPLKPEAVASPADRVAMASLLAGRDERFTVDAMEIARGGLSFTVETVVAFADKCPLDRLFLVVGADALATFEKWREPAAILSRVTIAVLHRGEESVGRLPASARIVGTRRVDISSTEIRRRVRDEKPIGGFVPDDIAAYIAATGLYR
ncbi:MAG: nicotinate-nucleotide adenylyltransferase [Gemmatimonadaceae bacterium]